MVYILEADGEDIARFMTVEYADICIENILKKAKLKMCDEIGMRHITVYPDKSYLFDWDLLNQIRGDQYLSGIGIYIPTDCEFIQLITRRE